MCYYLTSVTKLYEEGCSMSDRIRIIASEIVLGTVVVAMTILTAVSGYDGSMADTRQNVLSDVDIQNKMNTKCWPRKN